MRLTKSEIVVIISAFGAVILSALIHIGIREWYQPDVRYETGSFYISENIAITSLKLKNYGHSDAEDITINARFGRPILDVSTDTPSIRVSSVSGGIEHNYLIGRIKRLSPGQSIFVYFAIDKGPTLAENLKRDFLKEITYKNGRARTGQPIWKLLMMLSISIPIYVVIMYVMNKVQPMIMKKQLRGYYKNIKRMVQIASNAALSRKSEDQFLEELEDEVKEIKFRQKGLKEVAMIVFKARLEEEYN